MKANELRIGNYLHFPFINKQVKVIGINAYEGIKGEILHKISLKNETDLYCERLDTLNPLPLTEEILLKCGFEKGSICYHNAFSLNVKKTDFYLRPSFIDGFYWGFNMNPKKLDCELNDVMPLQYLHQLQNLYFALTGTELEINL